MGVGQKHAEWACSDKHKQREDAAALRRDNSEVKGRNEYLNPSVEWI